MNLEADLVSLKELRDVAARAARAGGDAIRAVDRDELTVGYKTPLDITTSADQAAHAAVLDVLVQECPDHAIRGEDGDRGADGVEYVWYVDALDGTANYAASIPYYCVSVGLRRTGPTGRPATVAAAVHDPVHDELYDAALGAGARRDGRFIRVSATASLDRAVVATQIKTADPAERDRFVAEFGQFVSHCAGVRVPGCRVLMLCHVADGRFTAHVERGLDAWDLAAGSLILTEAGGTLTDFHGRPVELADSNDIVATNGPIHGDLIQLCSPVGGPST